MLRAKCGKNHGWEITKLNKLTYVSKGSWTCAICLGKSLILSVIYIVYNGNSCQKEQKQQQKNILTWNCMNLKMILSNGHAFNHIGTNHNYIDQILLLSLLMPAITEKALIKWRRGACISFKEEFCVKNKTLITPCQ